MSEDISSTPGSPSKTGWVKFDEADSKPDSPAKQSSSNSSGISSARGSVNSVQDQAAGAQISVSEIQVSASVFSPTGVSL